LVDVRLAGAVCFKRVIFSCKSKMSETGNIAVIACSDGQWIGRIAGHNDTVNANFVHFGSRDRPQYINCAKPASFD